MIIGHLPAGYLLTRSLEPHLDGADGRLLGSLGAGLLGSIFPDVDLLYFYFVDQRRHLHHHYWIHRPFDWAVIAAVFLAVTSLARMTRARVLGLVFFANVFLHLLLDTTAGKIDWLYPLSTHGYSLVQVPARHRFWLWNFVFHWTFLLEIAVIAAAALVLWRERRAARPSPSPATLTGAERQNTVRRWQ